jgi:hypothetical protein
MPMNTRFIGDKTVLFYIFIFVFAGGAFAQTADYSYRCQGRVNQDQRKLIILNINVRLGGLTVDGDLNGDALMGSVFGSSESYLKVIAGRRSEFTGNARDQIHKVTIEINKPTSSFNLEVLGVNGYSYFLSGSGSCR